MKKLYALLAILLIILLSVGAAVTVTYEPSPALHFEPSFSPLDTGRLVGLIGTLTFTATEGSNLYQPVLMTTAMSFEFNFTGPMSWSGPGQYNNESSFFRLYAVSTANGKTEAVVLWHGNNAQMLRSSTEQINTNPLVVKLYVQSHHPISLYKPGGTYVLSSGTLGGFQIVMAKTTGGYNSGGTTTLSVNGAAPTTNTPILAPGTNPSAPIIYGDPPQQVSHTFSIINKQTINLLNAVGNLKAKVAEAQIIVSNGVANKNYGVNVTFTNQTNTNPFQLTMKNVTNPPTIPYSLYFNNQSVTPGMPIPWNGLKNGTKTLDILVTGVSTNNANLALAGYYQDTIVVNIVPIDSI